MKAADLHNGLRRAVQGLQQPSRQCARCRQAPVARYQQYSLPIRSFTSSSLRRAEDEPSRITKDEARLADANAGADATTSGGLENAPSFTAAPEIDLESDLPLESNIASEERAGVPAPKVTESLESRRRSPQPPPRQQQYSRYALIRSKDQETNLLDRLRVVPASPSYFTSRPNFTDHYLEISALYRRHQLLPSGGRSETKITWLSLQEYKSLIGDEPVAAGRYRELIKMCGKLSSINPHLMPDEVTSAIARFMKEEQPRVMLVKKSVVDEHGRAYGLGRRKSATARAWIVRAKPGQSNVFINGKSLSQYFSRITQRESAIYALTVTERVGDYNVWGVVEGGGNTGQAEALTLAVAKALCVYEPQLKMRLKSGKSCVSKPFFLLMMLIIHAAGCLTRDRRKVERKKPGHLKARKKPAWVKR